MKEELRRHTILLVILLGAAFMVLSYISLRVFQDFPFCLDEYNYFYQAKIFSTGRLFLHADPGAHDLFEQYMIFSDGRLFSKYPPGFSFLLVPGIKLGCSGLVNPMISVGTLIVIILLTAEVAGVFFSFWTILLIISNIYFLGYGASYFSQPASLFLASLAFVFYKKNMDFPEKNFLPAAASAIAIGFLVRPLDAFCVWLALAFGIVTKKEKGRWRSLLVFSVISAGGMLLLMAYNRGLIGQWGIAPYPVMHSDFKIFYEAGTFFGRMAVFLGAFLANLRDSFWLTLTRYFLPLLVCWMPFLLAGFFRSKNETSFICDFRNVLFAYILILVLLYNVHPFSVGSQGGWPQYGGRYWYPLIAPFGIFLAIGMRWLYENLPKYVFVALLAGCIAFQLLQSVVTLDRYSERFRFIKRVQSDIEVHCPLKSIVVLKGMNLWNRLAPSFDRPIQLKRNPFLSGQRLYVWPNADLRELRRLYPGYSVSSYDFSRFFQGERPRGADSA